MTNRPRDYVGRRFWARWRWLTPMAIGFALLGASTARAEQRAAENHEEAVPIEVATKAQREGAKKQLQEGIELFQEGKFEEALASFRASFSKVSSPNTRLMIARCLAELKRYPEAYQELKTTISEARTLARGASKYEKTLAAANAELEKVSKQVAIVELDVGAEVSLGGKPLPPAEWQAPLVLQPGANTLELVLSNGESKRVTVDLRAGQQSRVELAIDARPKATSRAATPVETKPETTVADNGVARSALAWTGAGVGIAGALGFAIFGSIAAADHDQLEDECDATRCPANLREVAEEGRTFQTYANVSAGIGVVGLITALYFFVSDSGGDEPTVAVPPKRVASESDGTARLFVGSDRVGIEGRF